MTKTRTTKSPPPERGASATSARLKSSRGEALPLGLHECDGGVNLAVFSRHATHMTLLLFDRTGHGVPSGTIDLDPRYHRSGDVWHVRLMGDLGGMLYVLQAQGPDSPADGHRFNAALPLLDPYAPVVLGAQDWGAAGQSRPKCAFSDQRFDWQDDAPPRRPWRETVIYETHVRGLTMHPSSGAAHRGQYLGVVEKIPYLRDLGITALELMPVQAFDPRGVDRRNPSSQEALRDYWGYNPLALFAPMAGYSDGTAAGAPLVEFKTMVRELHEAGIEVVLDVVFNHTAEAGEGGPTYSFRGLDNSIYYLLTPDKQRYLDYTGCGNTLNCNHPVVRAMIVDCLRHWVMHFHVDGFRFDLASVLSRDAQGNLLSNPPLLEQIAEDPILRDVKLIAEAWDSGGAFQVGHFPGTRWAEWNSHYRDDVRRFWRGDAGMTGRFASRLCGSADLYQRQGESPVKSINFVTCHDGFTLNDLVSYAVKHNEANGEDNQDGLAESYSENNGVEGPSEDATVEAMRERQMKNMLATLLLSRGVPMLLGGDEFRRTQRGNNNAYCQDNDISWFDWDLAERHKDLVRFVRKLLELRRARPVLSAERFYTAGEIAWFGADGRPPAWEGAENRLACVVAEEAGGAVCLLFNATREACIFVLPASAAGWRIAIDTSRTAPDDAPDGIVPIDARELTAAARSVVLLASDGPGQA